MSVNIDNTENEEEFFSESENKIENEIDTYLNSDLSKSETLDADTNLTESNIDSQNISKEQELKLIEKVKKGDDKAKNELFLCYKRFAYFLINKYYSSLRKTNPNMFEDFYSIAYEELYKAAKDFNPNFNVRFITYYGKILINSINKFITNNMHSYKIPSRLLNEYHTFMSAKQELDNERKCDNSFDEVNKVCFKDNPFTDEKLVLFNNMFHEQSFDANLNEDGYTLSDIVRDHNTMTPQEYADREMVLNGLKNSLIFLNKDEYDILAMRFGLEPYNEEYQLEDIAKKYKVSPQAISQKIKTLLNKLRKIIERY